MNPKQVIAGMQVQRGVRHDLEYGARRMVSEEEVGRMRDSVCAFLDGRADEIRQIRPPVRQSIRELRCP